jgi:phosphoglycolate phosphatase-like HAD superfamily hydrolase
MYLSSWKETTTKQAILDFLVRAGDENSSDYIPSADRIAAFDNDGTLWVEQPMPAQTDFLLGKLAKQVKANPALAAEEPYKSIVNRDPAFLQALSQQSPDAGVTFLKAVVSAWEGTSPEAYEAEAQAFLAALKHPRYGCLWIELIYQPMIELFDLLRANGWRVFVCSGGGRDFMRVFSEQVWGILREDVIGSAPQHVYENGRLVRSNAMLGNVALGPGKVEHIYDRTGRMALFAGGNADVNLEMLQAARFRLVVVHDDPDREYVTTAAAEKLLTAGYQGGWVMVSMKNDWKTIYKD